MNKSIFTLMTAFAVVLQADAANIVKQIKADFPGYGSQPFVHYALPPMSEVQRLPDVYPEDGKPGAPVKIFAAKGEFEPGSFSVWGCRECGKVTFTLDEFKSDAGKVFPAKNLDLKLVKCWYQNLNGWFSYFADSGDSKLCPELLLNDEELIRTDTKTKANYARIIGADGKKREQWINPPPKMDLVSNPFNGKESSVFQPMAPGFDDAAEFQPVRIPKEEFRTFFLTANVTKDIPAGVYKGAVSLTDTARKTDLGKIPVEIHVADYELPLPKCYREPERDFLVWFYHYNALANIMGWNGGDRELAVKQLEPMLRDMAEHGQSIHPCWFAMSFEELYTVDLCIKAGMRPDTFVGGALPYGTTHEARMDTNVRTVNEYDRRFGCHNIYHCWGDEPGLSAQFFDQLTNFIEEWHSLGLKHFIAGEECCFRKLGFGIDWFNMATDPAKVENRQLRLWNSVPGKRAAWYARQHVGAENPALARRQNGLAPWLNGFNCFANYAHHLGPYNDNSQYYKPMIFFYGAHSRMIDTIAWEGFREGIDDIRYATLMTELARKAMASDDVQAQFLGGKAFQYLALVNRESDNLDTCRAEMRNFIDRLLKVVKQDPVVKPQRLPSKPEAADAALEAEMKPLREELAATQPENRGPIYSKICKTYEKFYRIEDLVNYLEKESQFTLAAKYAEQTFQFERADKLLDKVMHDQKVPQRIRAEAAWGRVFRHPEMFDDKYALEQLAFVNEAKTNNYVSKYNTYGCLNDASSHADRFSTSWRKAYKLVASVADNANIKGMGAPSAKHGVIVFSQVGDLKTVDEIVARRLSTPNLKPHEIYTIGLVGKLFGSEGGKPQSPDARAKSVGGIIKEYEKANLTADITTDQRMSAINYSGQIANALCDTAAARALEEYRVSLYKEEPRRQYKVKFSKKPVEGPDWTGINAESVLCDRKYGGSTELMYTDVTTGTRNVGDSKAKSEPMRMQIAADAWGIHFRFEVTDTNAVEVLARRAGCGSFEGYVAPGKNRPYICFYKDDLESKWGIFNTVYDAIGQNQIDPDDVSMVRTYSSFNGNKIVNVMSISWECYADDLPRDGSVWDFEIFRWGNAGGGAWNGCRSIHERTTWGELVFDLSSSDRIEILRRAEENAYFRFRRESTNTQGIDRYEGCVRHWNDKHVGDIEFYETKVKPWADNLLEAGKVLGEKPSNATLERLEQNGTLSQWHHVFQYLDRMRYDWLTK